MYDLMLLFVVGCLFWQLNTELIGPLLYEVIFLLTPTDLQTQVLRKLSFETPPKLEDSCQIHNGHCQGQLVVHTVTLQLPVGLQSVE